MKKIKTIFSLMLIIGMLFINIFAITNVYISPTAGFDKNPAITWTEETEEFVNETFGHYENNYDKVCAFREWIMTNIPYTPYKVPFVQTVNIDKVIAERKGICFEQASLFTTFCRISGIEAYNVDGRAKQNSSITHSWNRFCIDGEWYAIDITYDQMAREKGRKEFGVSPIASLDAIDETYDIYRKY